VGPAVERKVGLSSFTELTIDSATWRSADWAWRKGLFAELHSNSTSMDAAIARLAKMLAGNNPEAMKELKKVFWKGTEDWDELLIARAAISGCLILSEHSKKFIENHNKKHG
jgi:methylglutaconyl-CoA hydratase